MMVMLARGSFRLPTLIFRARGRCVSAASSAVANVNDAPTGGIVVEARYLRVRSFLRTLRYLVMQMAWVSVLSLGAISRWSILVRDI